MKGRVPWNKGRTKENHPSLLKTSETLKQKKISNFSGWMAIAKQTGLIPATYPALSHTKKTAFLIGLTLGDGHICRHERTESLRITLGCDKPELWQISAEVVKDIFHKMPHVRKIKSCEAIAIQIYQKNISRRLGVPVGARKELTIDIPPWIWNNKPCLIACLKGLYEAEASLSVHLPTYTYNFSFSNHNVSLLDFVERSLVELGFHPERRWNAVRIRRKLEVSLLERMLTFRNYSWLK